MQEKQTRVDQKGGQKPVFGDKFEFKISNEKELHMEVYDKETLQNDKLIGRATVSIMQWLKDGYEGDVSVIRQREKERERDGSGLVVSKLSAANSS